MSGDNHRRNDDGAGVGRVAAGRITALVASVMDLHVRIALQEADKEKRRLISGGLLLGAGISMVMLATVASQLALVLWLQLGLAWGWIRSVLAVMALDLGLAGLFLRIGGQLTKGPYLPQTTAGLTKTTRAILGR
jgi:uncharacterized membrane protein YqjE